MLIERARNVSLATMKLVDTFPTRDFSLKIIAQQVFRSATSIGANIAEAQGASSRKDFINFLHHALKSANETYYWLNLLKDSKKVTTEKINPLLEETEEISKLLGSSILSLKGKRENEVKS